MILYPNAKINLGLAVTHRREDGYHDLETLFVPVPGLHDVLMVEPALELTFHQDGALDCPPEDNIVLKAYHAVEKRFPEQVRGAHITLQKRIPFGAGLGGGSADAACMVLALNELYLLGMTAEEMEALVSPLGADCAFFIQNRPRFAKGIGNIFSEADEEDLAAIDNQYIVLVKPSCAVSTAHAYRGIIPRDQRTTKQYDKWANDFETTVFPLFPEIEQIKNRLLEMGANFACMSGSGATVYGLFSDISAVQDAAHHTDFAQCFVHVEQLHTR